MQIFLLQVVIAIIGATMITLGEFVFYKDYLTIIGGILYPIGLFSIVYFRGYRVKK